MKKHKTKDEMPFEKENYILFGIASVLVVIGYLLIVGGGSEDPTVFNYEELFSFRRITLAPIVILIGIALGFYAIVKRPKNDAPIVENEGKQKNKKASS